MSDKWHKDHKKAIAEKWVQCPQVSARKQELLGKWAIGQVDINALREAHARAEKELAELKADRVAISQRLSDALDSLFASNKQLAEARSIIDDHIEREAAVCPEDVPLDEYIPALERQLAEARADMQIAKNIIEIHVERIAERDALIEQMRKALTGSCEKCPCDTVKEDKKCQDCDISAALSAAERIDK